MSYLTKPPRIANIDSVRIGIVKYVCNLKLISWVFTIVFNRSINGETFKKNIFIQTNVIHMHIRDDFQKKCFEGILSARFCNAQNKIIFYFITCSVFFVYQFIIGKSVPKKVSTKNV